MEKTRGIVDRFEGDFAVVTVGSSSINIPKKILPGEAKEGDVIYITVLSDAEETKNQEELARNMLNEVLKEE